MKTTIQNKILFLALFLGSFQGVFGMMTIRDMPGAVTQASAVQHYRDGSRSYYSHREPRSNFRHEAYYDENTRQYGGYSHHVSSGRIKTMHPEKAQEKYHAMRLRSEQYK